MSKNYKKIGFKKGEDYYKIKSFNVNDPNNTNDFYDCVELNDQTVFTNNLCIVEDLNQYANTTSLTTTSTTSTIFPTTTTTSTTFPTTITLNEPVSNNTTTHETTTSDSNSVSTTDSTPTSNLNVNSEPPETSESKQEDTNKAMVGMAVGTALGVTLFIVLVIILVSHLKKRRYNVNNTNTNTNNLNTNNSNEDHKNNEYVEPTDSLYLEPISHNPEYKSTENGENEGVYYPNEPLSPVVEKNEIEQNYEYDYASPEHSPVYDNPTGNYSNVYESDE
jgi:hypothetical protein